MKELDEIADSIDRCSSLGELLDSGLVELGRNKKKLLGTQYFAPEALIQITRFNFRLRLGFFRLMHSDLQAIRTVIQQLESAGVTSVDCREAGLGSEEPLATMRTLCHQWKKPFREAYRAGQSFRQLGQIRNILIKKIQTTASSRNGTAPASSPSAAPEFAVTVPDMRVEMESHAEASLEKVIEVISEKLFASKQKTTVSTVVIGHAKETLASWEVKAYVQADDATSGAIQRAVAARCQIANAAAMAKEGNKGALAEALDCAHHQAAAIQEQVAKAKERGDIDAAVSLAATAKRLLAVIDVAEKLK
jgi:hypothetical protein